ncbi:MAG: hypothetical protein ACXVB9_20920 [Bdellovibrionota bacterium]
MSSLNSVAAELDKKGIAFAVEDDKEMLAEQEKAWKERPPSSANRGAQYDPSFLFLDIDEAVYTSRRAELEALGIIADAEEPDFSQEDYVCTDCGKVVADAPGFCAKHGKALITWSSFVESKRNAGLGGGEAQPAGVKFMTYAVLILGFFALVAKFGGQLLKLFE